MTDATGPVSLLKLSGIPESILHLRVIRCAQNAQAEQRCPLSPRSLAGKIVRRPSDDEGAAVKETQRAGTQVVHVARVPATGRLHHRLVTPSPRV